MANQSGRSVGNQQAACDLFNHAVSPANFYIRISEKVEEMTLLLGKFALVIAAAGGLSIAALSPSPVEAGVMHPSLGLAAASGDSDVVRVRCDRRLSNLWSCNDEVRVRAAAVTCEAGTVTPPTHTRAITPIRPRGTARAAATAPPIRGPAEDKAGLISFRSTARSHRPVSTRRIRYAYVC